MSQHKSIEAYAHAFGEVTEENLPDLVAMTSPDIIFSDPFNTIYGQEGFRHVFDHMYKTCDDARFDITDIAHGNTASYIRWRMIARLKSWPRMDLDFEGMTEVHTDKNGLITAHYDHWDSASQLLAKLPVVGALVRRILKLFVLKN